MTTTVTCSYHRRVCPACGKHYRNHDAGALERTHCPTCGFGGVFPCFNYERSAIPRRWWQFWKVRLLHGMTWGPWQKVCESEVESDGS